MTTFKIEVDPRLIDILQRVADLPYFKNDRVQQLVWDARDLLKDYDATLPTAEDVRGILAPQTTVNQAPSEFDLAVMRERDALRAAALEFIAKVDQGAARSKSTYAAFKAALALTSKDSQ